MTLENFSQKPKEEKQSTSKDDAMNYLLMIEHQERQRGRFDVEEGEFRRLREALERDEITPQKAVEAAHSIAENRQDYN